jgi:hypothetical protein
LRVRAAPLLLGVLLSAYAAATAAEDVYVICHPAITLQSAEVRDVFVGDKGFAGSVKLAPADNSAAQSAFLEKVLKIGVAKYAGIWTRKAFRDGVNPPPVKASDAEALAYVRQTPGGCSYVTSTPGGGVSIVAKY